MEVEMSIYTLFSVKQMNSKDLVYTAHGAILNILSQLIMEEDTKKL